MFWFGFAMGFLSAGAVGAAILALIFINFLRVNSLRGWGHQ